MNDNHNYEEENRFLRINTSVERDSLLSAHERARIRNIEALSDWFKRHLGYTTFLFHSKLQYSLMRGEVYEVDFGRNVGSELNERHYAVILHDSSPQSQNALVCPLTTKTSEGGEAALINIGRLPNIVTVEDSFAKISQIRTIDKARIYIRPVMNKDYNSQDFGKKPGPVSILTNNQMKLIAKSIVEVFNNIRRI